MVLKSNAPVRHWNPPLTRLWTGRSRQVWCLFTAVGHSTAASRSLFCAVHSNVWSRRRACPLKDVGVSRIQTNFVPKLLIKQIYNKTGRLGRNMFTTSSTEGNFTDVFISIWTRMDHKFTFKSRLQPYISIREVSSEKIVRCSVFKSQHSTHNSLYPHCSTRLRAAKT